MSELVRKRPIQSPKTQNEPTAGTTTATTPPIDPALKLSPRQLEAINLLFAGKSFNAVSAQLGVDARTLYRWRQTAAFAEEIRRRYRERAVARKPPNRPGGLIPPPPGAIRHAREVIETPTRPHPDKAYWIELIESGKPFPPRQPREPYWLKVLRERYEPRRKRV